MTAPASRHFPLTRAIRADFIPSSNPGARASAWLAGRFIPLALTLTACGGMGESATETEPAATDSSPVSPSPCEGVRGAGWLNVEVRDQHELDALAACSTIVGDLTIQAFAGVDLRPLASLRTVRGTLRLGSLYEEPPAASFPSLDGLENLEAVAGLSLRGVSAPSLRALGSLSHFVPFADDGSMLNEALLLIDSCPELTDLSGLEGLEGLEGVVLKNNAKLTSLRGIQIPETMKHLEVWDSPVEDLGAISRLTSVDNTLWFMHTALQSAAGLERVARVDQLQFLGNRALRDLSALSALTHIGYLNLMENPELETLPVLDGLQSVTGLVVHGNAKLRELPSIPVSGWLEAWIENNASLERVLSLADMTRANQVHVANNPALGVLDLGQLQEVHEFYVTNNPRLDDSALRRLESRELGVVRIAGNLGETLPLAECPWTDDGICDERGYGVCAVDTDPDCVALGLSGQ